MAGKATDSQIAACLAALATKGETLEEVVAAVKVMRELSTKVCYEYPEKLVDTVGCGDGSSTFNISTCCTFVLAAVGVSVAKHGNRSNSSASGSSDVLAAAGANLDLNAEQVAECIRQVNLGFLFAPKHHSAMRHAVTARKEMGTRTLFNLLGPLTNPANAHNQVIGVFSEKWLKVVADTLEQLGSQHVMIVHARDGIDEISIAQPTDVVEMKQGVSKQWVIDPKNFGFDYLDLQPLLINSAEESLQMIKQVLSNVEGKAVQAAKDIIALNAGASLYVGGAADTFEQGVEQAQAIIVSGKARQKLDEFVAFTQSFAK